MYGMNKNRTPKKQALTWCPEQDIIIIIIIIIITTTYYGTTQPVLSSASQTIHYKHDVGCTDTVVSLVWKITKF